MIIVLKKDAEEAKVEKLKENLVNRGLKLHLSQGEDTTIIGLVGDTTEIEPEQLQAFDVVETVKRIKEPYKKANRSMHPQDSVIDICGKKFGGNHFQVIAGPCSVETREQMETITELGIDYIQGYYFSKPIPEREFLKFIRERNAF